MTFCYDLPVLGTTCVADLTFSLGGHVIDPTHPYIVVALLTSAVIGVFVFRSPN
jgi:hypothetical protein